MGINHITLIGRVDKAPEVRYTPEGVPIATLRVTVVRSPREGAPPSTGEVTDTFTVVAWRKLAEQVSEVLKKGDLVSVEGRMRTRTTESPEGQRRKLVEIEAQALEALQPSPALEGTARTASGAPATGGGEPAEARPQPARPAASPAASEAAAAAAVASADPFLDVPDFGDADEIPF